jgi:NTP pyrophosphatase (non-canonical NTP hydrolase)
MKAQQFADDRSWQEHDTVTNLYLALVNEMGELAGTVMFLEGEKQVLAKEQCNAIILEIADVAIYILRLCYVMDVDVGEILTRSFCDDI